MCVEELFFRHNFSYSEVMFLLAHLLADVFLSRTLNVCLNSELYYPDKLSSSRPLNFDRKFVLLQPTWSADWQ